MQDGAVLDPPLNLFSYSIQIICYANYMHHVFLHDILHKKSKCEIGFFCGQHHMVN